MIGGPIGWPIGGVINVTPGGATTDVTGSWAAYTVVGLDSPSAYVVTGAMGHNVTGEWGASYEVEGEASVS